MVDTAELESLTADEVDEVQRHLLTQNLFRLLMKSTKDQFGFNEAVIGDRMMLMSRETDDILVFKDRISRLSLILNTETGRAEIPRGLGRQWDEIWSEFKASPPPTLGNDSEMAEIKSKIVGTAWYVRQAAKLIPLLKSRAPIAPYKSWTHRVHNLLCEDSSIDEFRELATAIFGEDADVRFGFVDLNQASQTIVKCMYDDLDKPNAIEFRQHPLFTKGLEFAKQYLTATDDRVRAIASVKLNGIVQTMDRNARYGRISCFDMMVREANSTLST